VNARWAFYAATLLLLSYGHGLFWPSSTLAPYALPIWLQVFEHISVLCLIAMQLRKQAS
jgi:hypothetical protein